MYTAIAEILHSPLGQAALKNLDAILQRTFDNESCVSQLAHRAVIGCLYYTGHGYFSFYSISCLSPSL